MLQRSQIYTHISCLQPVFLNKINTSGMLSYQDWTINHNESIIWSWHIIMIWWWYSWLQLQMLCAGHARMVEGLFRGNMNDMKAFKVFKPILKTIHCYHDFSYNFVCNKYYVIINYGTLFGVCVTTLTTFKKIDDSYHVRTPWCFKTMMIIMMIMMIHDWWWLMTRIFRFHNLDEWWWMMTIDLLW